MGTRNVRRVKNHIRGSVIFCAAAVFCAVAVLGVVFFPFWGGNRVERQAHISIDDATEILMDIYRQEYDSIFDNEVLRRLQYLHKEYGLVVTLYVYEQLDEFFVWNMPLSYKAEFRENADWLKIGFHSMSEDNPKGSSLFDFMESYERVEAAIKRFAGEETVTHVLRLHYWYATDGMVTYLRQQGVTGLLCYDSEEVSYNLREEQWEKLYRSRDGVLEANKIIYYVTDIRLENEDDIEMALEAHQKDRIIVIFTHAWCFEENYDKLEAAVKWLVQEEYRFGFLENMTE